MESFKLLPVTDQKLPLNSDDIPTKYNLTPGNYYGAGVYKESFDEAIILNVSGYPISNITDKDYSTSFKMRIIDDPWRYGTRTLLIFFDLPAIDEIDFDDCYLGMRTTLTGSAFTCRLKMYTKKFYVNPTEADFGALTFLGGSGNVGLWDDILKAYYTAGSPPDSCDTNFFTKDITSTQLRSGFQAFPLTITKDNYNQVKNALITIKIEHETDSPVAQITGCTYATASPAQLSVVSNPNTSFVAGDIVYLFQTSGSATTAVSVALKIDSIEAGGGNRTVYLKYADDSTITSAIITQYGTATLGNSSTTAISKKVLDIDLYELCLIYHKSVSVDSAVYSDMQGRTFNGSAWTARTHYRATGDLIADPVDMLEHFLRLQNWGYPQPSVRAGHEYSPAAKINPDAALQGFDYAGLDTIRVRRPSFQINSVGDSDISKICAELCQSFFMASYRNGAGLECVLPLDFDPYTTGGFTPAATIRFADGDVYGEIDPISEADPQYCWSQPQVQYAYDNGAGKYTKLLAITDVTASTFSAACVTGFENLTDAENMWNLCRILYKRHGNLDVPTTAARERPYIKLYADALWYLGLHIDWMLNRQRRISVPTNYEKGRGVYPGMIVQLTLSQTGTVYCIAEKIKRDKNADSTVFDLIIIADPSP